MKTSFASVSLHVFIGVFMFIASSVFAQGKRANIWYFGHQAGLDFNSGTPVVLTNSAMSTSSNCASISDNNGNLLFYTDGDSVWSKNHQVMPNGFLGGSDNNPGTIILPKPGNPYIYYVFTHDNPGPPVDHMKYHTIDIRLNNNKGDVTFSSDPILLLENSAHIAVPHANGQDYWILATSQRDYDVHAFHLSASGLDTNEVISANVLPTKGVFAWNASPDYSKIAMTDFGNWVKIYSFNNATGLVTTNTLTINIADVFCLQFSPDGSRLYAGTFYPGIVYQWNLSAGSSAAIISSQTLVGAACVIVECMQTGPDGKIYVVTNAYNAHLHCISNPNGLGSACGFQYSAISLGGRMAFASLPNFPRDFLTKNGLTVSAGSTPAEFDFNVYPNPAQTKIQVSLPSTLTDGSATLELVNALGQQMDKRTADAPTELLDVSGFEPGVYFIKITSGKNSASRKFVVL